MSESITRYSTAKEYIETIKLALSSPYYKDKHVTMAIRPTGLLLGFALELYFKAWLLGDGAASKEVFGYGHRLLDLYREVYSRGFQRDPLLDALVSQIAEPHGQNRDYTYRYTNEDSELPILIWDTVLRVVDRLDVQVDTKVGASAAHGLQPRHMAE